MNKRNKRLLILAALGILLGQLLFGKKQIFCRDEPFRRGEVVLFRHHGETCLKRIYALPGDEVVIFRLDDGFNLLIQAREYMRYYRLVEEIGSARIDRFDVPAGELFLLGDAPDEEAIRFYSLQRNVTPETPPAFIWHTAQDASVPAVNSMLYAAELQKNGVPYELHIFPFGAHGKALAENDPSVGQWKALLQEWMGAMNL